VRFSARKTFKKLWLNGGGVGVGKMCFFQRKTGHILEPVRDKWPKLLLITNKIKKWHKLMSFSHEMKIIDLG